MFSKTLGSLLKILVIIHFCSALQNTASKPFSLVSLPQDIDNTGDKIEIENDSSDSSEILSPINVEIKSHSDTQKRVTTNPMPNLPFSGIRDKITIEPEQGNPNIKINVRSKSGTQQVNDQGVVDGTEDPMISWREAYSQSVKRVYVREKDGKNVVNHNRNIVKLQPIVPFQDDSPDPPPHQQVAKMARFIVHNSNWTSVATISSRSPIRGFPFANVFSVSDGPVNGNSSGIPYMYLTPLEISVKDLKLISKCSLTMSLAQGDYCRKHKYDPEDPRCAHVILTGNFVQVKNSSSEADFARNALFSRHPDMPSWPQDHGWFFGKLEIQNILVLDYFGGAKSVTPDEYFRVEL